MSRTRSRTDSLAKWQLVHFNISQLTLDAVKPFGLGNKEALRCKNMWTLGLALWMFDRDRQPIVDWLNAKFAKAPELAEANIAALNAGHAYGETVEIGARSSSITSRAAPAEPGLYRTVTGAELLALGLVAGAQLAGLPMFFGGYPITPAVGASAPSVAAEGIWDHDLPGGGRDCGHLLGDRRELRRPAWHHVLVGSGHCAQDRGARPRDHDRASARSSSIRSAAGRRPAFRPRPSSPISTRPSTAATPMLRCR